MSPVALNLAVLRSADIRRAVAFYSRIGLQFVEHRHGNGPVHFAAELPGGVFELYPLASDEPPTSATRVGFSVPSVDAVIEAFADWPDAIASPAKASPWGYRAVLIDPDGHRVEVVEAGS